MCARESAIILNGERVTFTQGETIYEVAARTGTKIPSLCYDPRLAPFGGCRLCVVRVKGLRGAVAACTTQAVDEMVVESQDDEIEGLRRTLLEMVASENPQIDVDPLRGYASQELTALVDHYAARTGRFAGAQSGHSRPDDPNPFILRDYDLCIACYRCVRVCAEQEGDYAISITNRGFHTQIATEFNGHLRESACTFCGQCVQTCPTGALADKKALRFAED
jgi:formate dehydrogenase alpha subunit